MAPSRRFLLFFLVSVSIAAFLVRAQDPSPSQDAVRLLEQAHRVSLLENAPNYELNITFRTMDASQPSQVGTIRRVVIHGVGRRDEFAFGDFHVINVWTSRGIASTRKFGGNIRPPELDLALRYTPMYLVTFDKEDTVHEIVDRLIEGKRRRCIEFETVVGPKRDQNELCVDPDNGTLVTEKLGQDLIENGDFFTFAGAFIPGRVVYSFKGEPKLEMIQTMAISTESPAEVMTPPKDAQDHPFCKTSRRVLIETSPMPPKGAGAGNVDAIVRGVVEADGRIHRAVIDRSERPDLNAEALDTVAQWTFTPALCDGNPNPTMISVVVHFFGR
ncbi:MAG TPA: energy transducer TonB [Candidatus Acidoferrales bacterium]|nr:energy transducer TonB [Candidatus Acidoferrales bacterium]